MSNAMYYFHLQIIINVMNYICMEVEWWHFLITFHRQAADISIEEYQKGKQLDEQVEPVSRLMLNQGDYSK